MIIVEGPDGSGKDTLIDELIHQLGVDVVKGPRAVKSSISGPVDNLGDWVLKDYREWGMTEACRIYNRHPLISEKVYGPVLRGGIERGLSDASEALLQAFAGSTLVIMCRPPLEVVRECVNADRDMRGVVDNIDEIYSRYQAMEKLWPGWMVKYDWTNPGDFRRVLLACMAFIFTRKKEMEK